MDAILPCNTLKRETFLKCARELGFDKMAAEKFIFIMQKSDLDVYPLMCEERINMLLYVWELCDSYLQTQKSKQLDTLKAVVKMIVPYSLSVWFSEEWKCCRPIFRLALLTCLTRAKELLKMCFKTIEWEYWLNLGITPYNVNYLKSLNVVIDKNKQNKETNVLESIEENATFEDINYITQEQLPLILLRLIKLFDSKSMEVVKALSMRVLAAWNKIYYQSKKGISKEDKRCLILICHVHLMTVYELDDVHGYIIDNMMNNIRFYYEGFKTKVADPYTPHNLIYTPARYIALTCVHLALQKREFFESFIWHSYDNHMVTLFDVISQSYRSYLVGNILMELNLLNEQDFAAHLALYKSLINRYVIVRENSEQFMLEEMRKKEAQRYAHNVIQTIKYMTDFKSKICKGNRMSNIGNYENVDDKNVTYGATEMINGNERKLDPVFQYIPDNKTILYFVYELLASRSYKGWHFAKIVLLLKIIRHELNGIDTWRYHPGLTIEFMLNLEKKLSRHYEDLAKVFEEHPFLEQEFWLTAFYLNPTNRLYDHVVRCGTRFHRRIREEQPRTVVISSIEKNNPNTKFGLLSSTIEVKDIVDLTNYESMDMDYEPLFKALHSLRLSDGMVKDILTIAFLPRIKTLAWVVNWLELRKRCKVILKDSKEKRRFVELNMAEANERLKFLKVDYDKYKNRPQLDYGTIEEGYENNMYASDCGNDSNNDEDVDEEVEDFEDDEDNYETPSRNTYQKQKINVEDKVLSLKEEFSLLGKRRTRARTAAAVAEAMLNYEKSLSDDSKVNIQAYTHIKLVDSDAHTVKDFLQRNVKDVLNERPLILNTTQQFKEVIDIWNIDNDVLKTIHETSIHLPEIENVFEKFKKLISLKEEVTENVIDTFEKLCKSRKLMDVGVNSDNVIYEKENGIPIHENDNKLFMKCIDFKEFIEHNPVVKTKGRYNTAKNVNIEIKQIQCNNEFQTAIVNDVPEGFTGQSQNNHNETTNIESSRGFLSKNYGASENTLKGLMEIKRDEKQINSFIGNCAKDYEESLCNSNDSDNVKDSALKDNNCSQYSKSLLKVNKLLELKKACFEKELRVRLQKLTVKDLNHLRQPRVLLKRLSMDFKMEPTLQSSKRRRVTQFICFETDVDDDNDDDDDSKKYYLTERLQKKIQRRHRLPSESSDYSISEEYKPRKSRYSRSMRGKQPNNPVCHMLPLSTRTAPHHTNLVVTPRSASGLKLRISHMQQQQQQHPTDKDSDKSEPNVIDIIQLSSASSDEDEVIPHALMPITELVEICTDPLFEEEIII